MQNRRKNAALFCSIRPVFCGSIHLKNQKENPCMCDVPRQDFISSLHEYWRGFVWRENIDSCARESTRQFRLSTLKN